MAEARGQTRRASVVSVDVFGFPRVTDDDRQKITLAYEALDARLETSAERHHGRVFQGAADGMFIELPSADEAVIAGAEIANGPWPPVRVGVHSGEVTALPSGELAGGAIATVARIQQAADAGAVLVSEEVKQALRTDAVSRRLTRAARSIPAETPGGSISVYGLTFVEPVDEAARTARGRRLGAIVAGALLAMAVVGVLLFGQDLYATLFPRFDHVAVAGLRVAANGGTAPRDLATSLTDEFAYDLAQAGIPTVLGDRADRVAHPGAADLARRWQVGGVLSGTVSGDETGMAVKVRLDDPVSGRLLWAHDFTGSGDDLLPRISSRVLSVLSCSAQAMAPEAHLPGADALALYVSFCDLNSDAASDPNALADGERDLRALTARAPEFSYGHSQLSLFLHSKSQIDTANAAALLGESAREADRALALDSSNADAYAARALLAPPPGWLEREKALRTAVAQKGAGALPNDVYALMLLEVGRLNDAAARARTVAGEDSGDPQYVSLVATTYAEQGKDDDADRALTRALLISPHDMVSEFFRFTIYQWLGRWDEALRILDDDANRSPMIAQVEDLAAARAFILAMQSQEPKRIAAARDAAFASVAHDRAHLMVALSHLSAMGLVDDAFRLAEQVQPSAQNDDVSVLFTPPTAALRRDPRFMHLAAKLGLTAYWAASGRWPDFCAATDLGYDCRIEARKAAAGS